MSEIPLHLCSIGEAKLLSANVNLDINGSSEKRKKLSYKDDITIPIKRDGHRIILERDFLHQEQARVRREELPYFRNLVQAAEGKR